MSAQGDDRDQSGPPRRRYDWPSVALFVIFLGAFVYALLRR
ncbi:hypothetical protein [Methylocystis sp. S23]|jgi:hypothetical protein